MNCKKGDLAIMVRSIAGNEGRIFTCLRLAEEEEIVMAGFYRLPSPMWVVDCQLRTNIGKLTSIAPDAWLRPLRHPGTDARDETLEWLPVPSKDTETA